MRNVVCTIALLAAATGCSTTRAATPLPDQPGIPAGSEEVVIQFSSGGGLPGWCCRDTSVPSVTVYDDGRVVFPGPLAGQVPAMRHTTLDQGDISGLLSLARETGLLGDPDVGVVCCDLGFTRVILRDAGTTHKLIVEGFDDESSTDVTPEQRRNRDNIMELRERLDSLVKEAGETADYMPAELAIYVAPEAPEPGTRPRPWPLYRSLAEGGTLNHDRDGRCLHLTTDTRPVIAAARESKTQCHLA